VTGDPPVVVDDTASTNEDTAVVIDVVGNDSDVDGDLNVASAEPTTAPTSGVAVGNGDGTITYTPDENFNGSDTFDYQVCDPTALCDTATVTVTVAPANQAPVVDAGLDTDGEARTAISLDATVTDDGLPSPPGAITTLWTVEPGAPGTATFTDNTAIDTTASFDTPGTYTFRLTADDSALTGDDTVVVTVTDPPLMADFSGTPTTGPAPLTVVFTDLSTGAPTSWAWDFDDGNTSTAQNPTHTYSAAGTYTVTLTATNAQGSDTAVKTDYITVTEPVPSAFYVSFKGDNDVGGLEASDEDILWYDGTSWTTHFDGSDMGVTGDLKAFHIIDGQHILMAFSDDIIIGGVTIDDHDIALFTATSLGENTTGAFSLFFDGDAAGLTTPRDDIDAIHLLPDGRLVLSTRGAPSIAGVAGLKDEDLFALAPAVPGDYTSGGSWEMYFDASDVGISGGGDIVAVSITANGDLYLSVNKTVTVGDLVVDDEDVFVCTPISLGQTTRCDFAPSLYFDGSLWALGPTDIDGLAVP
jgi:PKD repeat protein